MTRWILATALILLGLVLSAQTTPQWLWVRGIGGLGGSNAIAADAAGNVWVTGSFRGTLSLDGIQLSSFGVDDVFVAKLDADGNWLWAVQAGGQYPDHGLDIAIDAAGNCYVAGLFRDTAVFGATTLVEAGDLFTDAFVAKIDAQGNWLWARRAGGIGIDEARSVGVDAAGYCYLAGVFGFAADFGPLSLTAGDSQDIFIARLDAQGNWLWARRAGGSDADYANALCVDGDGNSFVTGGVRMTADFGPFSLTVVNGYSPDIFVTKLDPDGNFLWVAQAGNNNMDWGDGISLDSAGNCYVSGSLWGTVNFGAVQVTGAGLFDPYVAKLDPGGNWLWVARGGDYNFDYGKGNIANSAGYNYVTGSFGILAWFGTINLQGWYNDDIFVAKLDPQGAWIWALAAGGTLADDGKEIAFDAQGNSYVTGDCCDYVTFGSIILQNYSFYVAKISSDGTANADPVTPDLPFDSVSARPNPFTSSLQIYWQQNENRPVEVSVYNIRGELVARRNLGFKAPGEHQFSWDGTDPEGRRLAPGVYILRLASGSQSRILKILRR
ncbi:MAG TPA: FlgD immunoglobulin-like domain containing protein [Candidatus Syntrophosphaera sp.]|nr:FlgD immunoglobulin-like domain containing protein [Candidatus Syntrophosphaera sp.]